MTLLRCRLALARLQPVRPAYSLFGQTVLTLRSRLRPGQAGTNCRPDRRSCLRAPAADAVLSRGEKDTSLPWENPRTGARGTVTPIARLYRRTGEPAAIFWRATCSGIADPGLQGEACKQQQGEWEVRTLKPWRS